MYREMTRLLFPLMVAISGIALMTAFGQTPNACAADSAQKCAHVAPVVLPSKLPGAELTASRTARPLRVSLPDFLNLGAAPRRGADVIK